LRLRQRRNELESRTKLLALAEEEFHLPPDPNEAGPVIVNNDTSPKSPAGQSEDNEVTLNPRAAEFKPAAGMPPFLMTDVISALRLPAVQLMEYDGNPLKYWQFIRAFENTVEGSTADSATKLSRLLHYTKGQARRVIECCSVMEPAAGYTKARELLRQRFGNDYLIAEAWVRKISEGGTLKPNDRIGLQEFVDDLTSCIATLSTMNQSSELHNQSTLRQVAERLPYYLQARVKRELTKLRESGKIPDMEFLAKLIREEASEANDPVFGNLACPHEPRIKAANVSVCQPGIGSGGGKRSHAVTAAVATTDQLGAQSASDTPTRCVVCGESH